MWKEGRGVFGAPVDGQALVVGERDEVVGRAAAHGHIDEHLPGGSVEIREGQVKVEPLSGSRGEMGPLG
jgi:hypothetical protein